MIKTGYNHYQSSAALFCGARTNPSVNRVTRLVKGFPNISEYSQELLPQIMKISENFVAVLIVLNYQVPAF